MMSFTEISLAEVEMIEDMREYGFDRDTSRVTDLSRMFEDVESFNEPIGRWDTTNPYRWDTTTRNLFPATDDDDDDDYMRRMIRALHDTTPELKGSYALPAHALPHTGRFLMDVNFLPIAECDCIPMAEAYYESELQSPPTDRQVAFGAKILATLEDDGIDDEDSMDEYHSLGCCDYAHLIEEGSVISFGHVSYLSHIQNDPNNYQIIREFRASSYLE